MIKKIIAVILCICISAFGVGSSFFAYAAEPGSVGLDDGIDALRAQFKAGIGPSDGIYTIDYEYYTPVSDGDATKYPLVIWLHGFTSGEYPGEQIKDNDIPYWTSKEFQARFTKGGAFIFAPRSPQLVSLWGDSMLEPLKATVDYFIQKNYDNIDTTRIYIGGLSMGGKMALQMAAAYPEMFAAAFPCSPTYYTFSLEQCENMKSVPVWMLSCVTDFTINYTATTKPMWNNIVAVSDYPAKCRLSTFTNSCLPNGMPAITSHHTWYACTYDMFTEDNGAYYYMSTVNGNGKSVTLTYPKGMIWWLCQSKSTYMPEKESSGISISTNIYRFVMGIFLAFINYFLNIVKFN